MSESESEDEILDRIEAALRKIAGHAGAASQPAGEDAFDRAAVTEKLDDIIAKLRGALEGAAPRHVESAPPYVADAPATPEDNTQTHDELETPQSEAGSEPGE